MKKCFILVFFYASLCFGQEGLDTYTHIPPKNLGAIGMQINPARNVFIGNEIQGTFDYRNISKPNTSVHSSFKPFVYQPFLFAQDSLLLPFQYKYYDCGTYGYNRFWTKHFNVYSGKENRYNLQVRPIADVEFGFDMFKKKTLVSALGGAQLKMNFEQGFSFAFMLVGGQNQQPFFLDTTLKQQRILPMYGQAYGNNYSFFDYTGYVSYTPKNNRYFNFQLGREKHFIGDGYRSLLLSDFSPANPYFGINANIWRLQYNVWYSWFYDVSAANGMKKDFTNKYGTFHYLSYNITKNISVGVFENIVWRGTDSNQVRTFEVNYLNPIIFFRPQEYAVGSPDNSFMGLNVNATIFKRIKLYAQLALDEFYLKEIKARKGWWANKQGIQAGAKYINAFGIKGLKLQAEYNQVRPYTYTHGLVTQNYGHYGLPLAHPLGANFKEFLGFLTYRKNKYEISCNGMIAILGKDTANTNSNVGQNIFLSYNTRSSDYGNYITQGVKTALVQAQLKVTYFIIPDMNMRVEAGYLQRSEKNSQGYLMHNPYFFVAFKTSFWNEYRDY